jgi:hypothetical protein
MTTALERIDALVACRHQLEPWLGPLDKQSLVQLLESQLGSPLALDTWIIKGDTRCKATPITPLLHILSSNTPHSAFQSIVRGLLVGCFNRVKLPSSGLPEVEAWIDHLPDTLKSLIEISTTLHEHWLESPAAVIFGNEQTIETFRRLLPPSTRRIEHGPKLSAAVIFEPRPEAARLAAIDILSFEQLGCLSVQSVYVAGGPIAARSFAALLAEALKNHRATSPRPPISLSDAGAISNTRETIRFQLANGGDLGLWESQGDTSWTVVYRTDPTLAPGPLHGFVNVHPLPSASNLSSALGPETVWLSTVAIHPFSDALADRLETLSAPRVCPLGSSQNPPLFWHHDGRPPLADLVTWRDRA